MQDLKVVDMDLVRELRRQHKFKEASDLVEAHQNNLKKSWQQGRKEVHLQDVKVRKHKKKHLNSKSIKEPVGA